MLKRNKSKDAFNIMEEHFILANSETLIDHIRDIFNNSFSEQAIPSQLAKTTLIPLVKSYRKSLKDGNNYRGISLIPIMTKILEYIIMLKCPQLAKSRKEQHGSKKKSSTIHAEFLISETIHYYNTNGSSTGCPTKKGPLKEKSITQ